MYRLLVTKDLCLERTTTAGVCRPAWGKCRQPEVAQDALPLLHWRPIRQVRERIRDDAVRHRRMLNFASARLAARIHSQYSSFAPVLHCIAG
jgi:hypothetical protein